MTDMMVNIMVEVLDILATATKEMKQSRFSEFILSLRLQRQCWRPIFVELFLSKVAGITRLDDGLKKLDKMTNEEARMANAEVLRLTHNIDKDVKGIGVRVQGVDENVEMVKEKVQMVIDGAQTMLS